MRWVSRYRLRTYVRNSAWLVPTAAIPAALVAAPAVRWIDARTTIRGLGFSSGSAHSVLNAVTPATLTFIIFILSTLLLVVQLAASQFSPRLIGGLLNRRPAKVCLFVFVFSYVYCAATIGRIDDGERVPQLPVMVAIFSTLFSVGAGLFLVDYFAKELRPVRMLARTAATGRDVIEQVYPRLLDDRPDDPGSEAENGAHRLPEPCETIAHAKSSGVFLALDQAGLLQLARRADGAIEIIPQVGEFVARGDPLFRVHPPGADVPLGSLYASIALGNERTADQDPTFAIRILVDVACRALSPAVNDPTTAVLAIDQLHPLLRQVGLRRLDNGDVRDPDGRLRLLYRTPDWEDFVMMAVTEIRHYGCNSIQVARRLRAMLENLIATLPPHRTTLLREQLQLLHSGVQRSFKDLADRTRAGTGDYQGVGSSRDGTTDDSAPSPPAVN